MHFHVITLFPEAFDSYLNESIIGRAIKEKKIKVSFVNPRSFVTGKKYKRVWPDGNVSQIVLPGGLNTMISGIGVFYPDMRPTQRVGIVPDIEVRPTIAGVRAGRDEVLEEALRQILGRQTPQDRIEKMAKP